MQEQMIGDRIRLIRRRAGLTQEQLAERMGGISRPYISHIETGVRALDDRDLLYRFAAALKCSVQTLTGEPYAPLDPSLVDFQMAMPQIEAALNGAGEYDEVLPEPLPLVTLLSDARRALALRMASEYGELGRLLPGLTIDLYRHAREGDEGTRQRAWQTLTQVNVCTSLAVKGQGYVSLGVVAADAAMRAAQETGDLADLAAAEYAVAQALVASRARRRSLHHSTGALERLDGLTATPGGQEMAGMLHLQSALVEASLRNTDSSAEHLAEARALARSTGEGSAFGMYFGPANVTVWAMSTAVEAREGGRVAELANDVEPGQVPTNDRKSRYFIELGRGQYQEGRYGEALGALLQAEATAPHVVRTRTVVRELVGQMVRHQRRRVAESPLGQLAHRLAVDTVTPE